MPPSPRSTVCNVGPEKYRNEHVKAIPSPYVMLARKRSLNALTQLSNRNTVNITHVCGIVIHRGFPMMTFQTMVETERKVM